MRSFIKLSILALFGFVPIVTAPTPARAYQVDCAILICLAGGWPASAPCAHARAVFIRRITPWPVEPPLQIWRCPMRASFQTQQHQTPMISHANLAQGSPFQSLMRGSEPFLPVAPLTEHSAFSAGPTSPSQHGSGRSAVSEAVVHLAQAVGTGADIDLSDSAFDFMRSIDVFQVQLNQHESGSDGDCNRNASVRHGRYESNGQFRWHSSVPSAVPAAFVGDERYGSNCPTVRVRAVFVDWADYEGNYGFEQVNY